MECVKTWVKGLKQLGGITCIIVPCWNLEVVLSALKVAPFDPIEKAALRCITLKTVFFGGHNLGQAT